MPDLIFLSSNEILFNIFTQTLTGSIKIIWVKTLSEAYAFLQNRETRPFLFIVDGCQQPDLSVYFSSIIHTCALPRLPFVVLIDTISAREAVIANGASGYLLLPLLQVEIKACIKQYLDLQELYRIQDEMQNNTAQMAYLVLISRIIIESSGLDGILSKALQQIVNIFNADGGEAWLLSEDGMALTLESSIFLSPYSIQRIQHYPAGQGLIGMCAEQKTSLTAPRMSEAPGYNEKLDYISAQMDTYPFLAVSLHTSNKNIGVLVLYRETDPFQSQEVFLMEEIALLVASGVDNTQALQSINYYAEQQHVLYEMSQQISTGLDLNITLKRAIQWIGRLTDAEIGFIWLANDSHDFLEAVTSIGMELTTPLARVSIEEFNFNRTSIVVNDPSKDSFTTTLSAILKIRPQNALILAIKQRGHLLGMVTLFNKISGPFLESEQKLLTTAVDMIAISISNAKLYRQTRFLMDEKERSHQKALQNERLQTIGRLTASVAHEINNPMQAIRGALSLALEDLNDPAELEEYIRLSQQEVDRVIKLVNRMRQLYRPTINQVESVQILGLLRDVLEITRDEMVRQNVKLSTQFPENSPVCNAIASHLHLAFLTILLNLTDASGEKDGGNLLVKVSDWQNSIRVDFAINPPINTQINLEDKIIFPESIEDQVGMISGFAPVVDAIAASGGKINLVQEESQTILRVELCKNPPEVSSSK